MEISNIKKGKVFLGKYKIIDEINRGGMGSQIYLAENLNYNKEDSHFSKKYKYSAIKFINKTDETTKENWNKILDESVTNARLTQSDNIVQLYEMHPLNKDSIALVMEYVDGPNLKELIRERGCLPLPEAFSIFKKILIGVIEMHSKDSVIIHRDLKPENIILSKDKLDVKIADFGISSVLVENDNFNDYVLTDENSFFGTIPYVTPDAVYNKSTGNKMGENSRPIITKQYDFHALGIIFYEMLIGEKPFEILDENNQRTILYWKEFDITPMKFINPNIRNEIENVILRLTASKDKMMQHRYYDALEILNDINKIEEKIANKLPEDPTLLPYNERKYQNDITLQIIGSKKMNFRQNLRTNILFITSSFMFFILIILAITFIALSASYY